MNRTHHCAELRISEDKKEVSLIGWAQRIRDHGGKKFIDLRDREGLTQVVFDPDETENFSEVESFRRESLLFVEGIVRPRPEGTKNQKLSTGEIEVLVKSFKLVNNCEALPFELDEETYKEVNEELRLQYRYLDIRRPQMLNVLKRRHKFIKSVRDFLDEQNFIEVETPNLTKSTPEGSRDFLVPFRKKKGQFFALPQSPQMFKQLLMIGGVERYFQVASCFRDEDLRKDRQFEHKQIDMEVSFLSREELFSLTEEMFKHAFRNVYDLEIPKFTTLEYSEAMSKFGSDKPDLRIQGMELEDISDVAQNCGFAVFKGVVERGGIVKGFRLENGQEKLSRKEIDKLITLSQELGAKGLAWMKVLENGEIESSITKFFSPEELSEIQQRLSAQAGDLLFFVADTKKTTNSVLDGLRRELAYRFELLNKDENNFCFITEFPLFDWNEDEDMLTFEHSPFTMPNEKDRELLLSLSLKDVKEKKEELLSMASSSYDLVFNGVEVGSGALRIYIPELQKKIFELLGMPEERVEANFGWLIKAYNYGAPFHRGWGLGIDRILMLAEKKNTIRDVIAFPRNKHGYDPLTDSPAEVHENQLKDLGIKLDIKKKE